MKLKWLCSSSLSLSALFKFELVEKWGLLGYCCFDFMAYLCIDNFLVTMMIEGLQGGLCYFFFFSFLYGNQQLNM